MPALTVLLRESLKGEDDYVDPHVVVNCMKKIDPAVNIMPAVIEALNSDKADQRGEGSLFGARHHRLPRLADLDAAVANGQLRETPDVVALMNQLRKASASANK